MNNHQLRFYGNIKESTIQQFSPREPIVSITNDGKIIIGKDVSQDEATQTFIDFLVKQWNKSIIKVDGELIMKNQRPVTITTQNIDEWAVYVDEIINDGNRIVSHSSVMFPDGSCNHFLIIERV